MEKSPLIYVTILVLLFLAALGRARLERRGRWRGLFNTLAFAEISFITLLLTALIFFGCLQIFLRNVMHTGIIWADPLMRHIVLWLGCLGGVMATTRVRHISIDVLTRILPHGLRRIRDRAIHVATAIAASVLGMAAWRLVADEKAFGSEAFLGIGTWILQLVLPLSFFLISYRSFLNMWLARQPKPLDWEDDGGHDAPRDNLPETSM